MKPVDAVLAVTYRCNARCAMCGIWKTDPGPDLPPETFGKLPSSLRDINLTGGEPSLRDDLPEVHAAARAACPKARTIVSTNGLLTDRIVSHVREMARTELEKVGAAAMERFEIDSLDIVHRVGTLRLGEVVVAIVARAAHRGAAFDACRFAIDELKRSVPIWKKEFFEDGAVWVGDRP